MILATLRRLSSSTADAREHAGVEPGFEALARALDREEAAGTNRVDFFANHVVHFC